MKVKESLKTYELRKVNSDFKAYKLSNAESAEQFCRQFFGEDIEIFESFFVGLLDIRLHTVGWVKLSQGGTAGTVVDMKLLAKYAVGSLSHAVILCHNHPSGNLNPSQADKTLTSRAIKALDLLDIKIVDHIILTKESSFSFAENGILY